MFSSMIQNYINSSGESSAMVRARQLENYVNSVYEQKNQTENVEEFGAKPFNEVLKSSAEEMRENKNIFEIDSPPKIPFGALSVGSKIKTGSNIPSKSEILKIIDKTCEKYNMDSNLVKAVVKQESGFNPTVTSKAGALGLMQLMPSTAEALGVQNPLDAEENIDGGVRYLKSMLDKFNGNKILALAAYNAGPNAVSKYNGVPPYKETQNYVRSVLSMYL